jgi:hypothetical protein
MIISHQYKYVFVELPRTGTTSIGRELCKVYGGRRILYKHSTYHDFLRSATDEEKTYFVFSCIRNPLDDAVSRYYKLKVNHRERYTDPVKMKRRRKIFVERIEDRLFNFIQENDADFETFFLKFYIFPYNDWSSIEHDKFDFVIHFENLHDDFAKALELIGIEQKRQLPTRNKTGERARDYLAYYTPPTIKRAKRVFGPYMKQWGYEIPHNWGESSIPWWNQKEFEFFTFVRGLYWKHLRYRVYMKNNPKAQLTMTEFGK